MKRVMIKWASIYAIPNQVVEDIDGSMIELGGHFHETDKVYGSENLREGILLKNEGFGDFIIPNLSFVSAEKFAGKKAGDTVSFTVPGKLIPGDKLAEMEDVMVVFHEAILVDSEYGKFGDVLNYVLGKDDNAYAA